MTQEATGPTPTQPAVAGASRYALPAGAALALALLAFAAGWCVARDGIVAGFDLTPGSSISFDVANRNLGVGLGAITLGWIVWIASYAVRRRGP